LSFTKKVLDISEVIVVHSLRHFNPWIPDSVVPLHFQEGPMLETPTPPRRFDVRSPLGTAIPREFLRGAGPTGPAGNRSPALAEAYDRLGNYSLDKP